MNKHLLLSCTFAVLLSGCGVLPKNVQPLPPELAKHVVSVDRDGKLNTIGCDSCSQETYLDNIIIGIKYFQQKQQQLGKEAEVLFFVHGGLNKPDDSLNQAKQMYNDIMEDSQRQHPIYPIFIIWDSRGLSSYKEHLWSIRQGEESKTAPFSSPFYLLTDIGNSIVNAPKSWLVTGKHMQLNVRKSITEKETELSSDITKSGVGPMMSYTKTDYKPNLFRRLRWVLGSPSKAVVTPFAYTMGRPAWDIMLRRTNTLFYTPKDLKLQEKLSYSYSELLKRGIPGSGALYSLLEKLKNQLEQPENKNIKITMVGHSMGAIVVNKIGLLEPKLPYKNIVHMASADSINNLFNMVVPYINYSIEKKKDECQTSKKDSPECTEWAKGQAVNFYSLMLHPDNEDREEAWNSLVPSGSLLTWIDNMYTSPETVLDKRSGRWDNIKSSIKFLPTEVANNMHFKIFGLSHTKCGEVEICQMPQKHGDFDAMRFWDSATWK